MFWEKNSFWLLAKSGDIANIGLIFGYCKWEKFVLEIYLEKYPHAAQQVLKKRKSGGMRDLGAAAVVDLTADEVRLWATVPAGGSTGVRGPAGEAAAEEWAGQGDASGGTAH